MAFRPTFGDYLAQDLANRISSEATVAALKAFDTGRCTTGQLKLIEADGSMWVYHATSTASDSTDQMVITPTGSTGRWLRRPGAALALTFAVTFNTADAAVLFTVPAGAVFLVQRCWWDVTADFTGGTSSTIGLSSSKTAHSTKGDLQGGAAGDAAAALTTGNYQLGTIGADIAAGVILEPGNTIRFDRITSAFTAGTGNARVAGLLLSNVGVLWRRHRLLFIRLVMLLSTWHQPSSATSRLANRAA